MNDPIDVRNLSKHFDKVRTLDGISFTLRQGELFGFLGPNELNISV